MVKLIPIGLCTIRNEAQGIEGWAKMMLHFCDRVVALIDPHTSDNTEQILREKFPTVEIVFQDRSLGDSDDDTEGETHKTIMHANKSKWVQENIEDETWFMEMAADERFFPNYWEQLEQEIRFAQTHKFDAIIHRSLIEPIPVDTNQLLFKGGQWQLDINIPFVHNDYPLRYCIDWGFMYTLRHSRFQLKHFNWQQNDQPHHGFKNSAFNPLVSLAPIYHFHRVKYNQIMPNSWRDNLGAMNAVIKKYNAKVPIVPYCLPCYDWRTLDPLQPVDCDQSLLTKLIDINDHIFDANTKEEINRLKWLKQQKSIINQEKYYLKSELDSSMFSWVKYNHATEILLLCFRQNKKIYRYLKVPSEVYTELPLVPSAGKYYHSHIKGKYTEEYIGIEGEKVN